MPDSILTTWMVRTAVPIGEYIGSATSDKAGDGCTDLVLLSSLSLDAYLPSALLSPSHSDRCPTARFTESPD